ncbi:hypothetical protein GF351_01675 [Candidatus Woesearchaeota archaeon]|nr:hypothetical protein [Candidatus Woesearchaeota archaeon]
MNLTMILIVVFVLVVTILFYTFIRSVWKTFKFFLALVLIGMILLAISVFSDINDFKKNFPASSNLYLLQQSGKQSLITGYTQIMAEEFSPLSQEQISAYEEMLSDKDYQSIRGDHYKLFIIDQQAFDDIESIALDQTEFSKKQADQLLASENARIGYLEMKQPETDILSRKKIADDMAASDTEFKAYLFGQMLSSSLKKDPAFIFKKNKEGSLRVYPETMSFRFMKILPVSLIDKVTTGEQE